MVSEQIGSAPAVTQSIDGMQTAAGRVETGPQTAAPSTTESGSPQCPGLPDAKAAEAATPARVGLMLT